MKNVDLALATSLEPVTRAVLLCLHETHGTIAPDGPRALVCHDTGFYHVSLRFLTELHAAGLLAPPDADGRAMLNQTGHAVASRVAPRVSPLRRFFSAHP